MYLKSKMFLVNRTGGSNYTTIYAKITTFSRLNNAQGHLLRFPKTKLIFIDERED